MVEYVHLNINGTLTKVPKGSTILDAARACGVDIPTLCESQYLKPFGSCSLCVVEVQGVPKLLRACSTDAAEGMIVKTRTPRVIASRKTALELLLSDHCGDCRPPCVMACPTNCDAQGYIALIANGMVHEAVGLIKETLPIPASIGRVCPHPCEEACRRNLVDEPMSICALKRYVADKDMESDPYLPQTKPATHYKVAVVGSGPAGLSAAYFLALNGHEVTVFESKPEAGGMLRYGIPEYRLPKKVLQGEIDLIERLGVKVLTGQTLGKDFTISKLKKDGYKAIFLGLGSQKSRKMGVKGEDAPGVLGGIDFLGDVAMGNAPDLGENVAVIGGGNTAMDAARSALRLGAKNVWVIYRRSRAEMPARDLEVQEAEEEGVAFMYLTAPVEVTLRSGKLDTLVCQKMELGEPDASGRRRPIPIKGSEFTLEVNTVIAAIGQEGDLECLDGTVTTGRNGIIVIDKDTLQTNMEGVFAGGDVVTGPGIAVEAVAQGKRAAQMMDKYVRGLPLAMPSVFNATKDEMSPEDFKDREKLPRQHESVISPDERKHTFKEFAMSFTTDQALNEANRCLECGCLAVFDCKLRAYASEYGVDDKKYAGTAHDYPINVQPYIIQDPNKCILCGQCVRECDEVRGIGALGFVNRGFDTVVRPAFEMPLTQTECDWCGECVSICPTGALTDNCKLAKPGPWETTAVNTTCGYCDLGCDISLNTRGNLLVSASPVKGLEGKGTICVKGRFGTELIQHKDRLTAPLVRKNGELSVVAWEEALGAISGKVSGSGLSGKELAVFVSGSYTNEEIYLINRFSGEVLGTSNVTSLGNAFASGIRSLVSSVSTEEIPFASTVLIFNVDFKQNPQLKPLINEAMNKGVNVVQIGCARGYEDLCSHSIDVDPDDLLRISRVLPLMLAQERIIQSKDINCKDVSWQQALRSSGMDDSTASTLFEAVKEYATKQKSILVCGLTNIADETGLNLYNFAGLCGKLSNPNEGILFLRGMANALGQTLGLTMANPYDLLAKIETGEIKGAFIFGEDPTGTLADNKRFEKALKSLELLVVQDVFVTPTASLAHVVLPACTFAETKGTFTALDGKIRLLVPAIQPVPGKQNWEIISDLSSALGVEMGYQSPQMIWMDLARNNETFHGLEFPALRENIRGRLSAIPPVSIPDGCADNQRGQVKWHCSFIEKYLGEILKRNNIRGYSENALNCPCQAAD